MKTETDKHIALLNISIINQNKELCRAKILLAQWASSKHEDQQDLIGQTKHFLNIV